MQKQKQKQRYPPPFLSGVRRTFTNERYSHYKLPKVQKILTRRLIRAHPALRPGAPPGRHHHGWPAPRIAGHVCRSWHFTGQCLYNVDSTFVLLSSPQREILTIMNTATETIDLGGGYSTRVTSHTFDKLRLRHFKWRPFVNKKKVYACAYAGSVILLHRCLLGAKRGQYVDHVDGDGLNNADGNIRFCTQGQNMANRKPQKHGTSGFKGIFWTARARKWASMITARGTRYYLGLYIDKRRAALAYDRAAKALHGEFAGLNFPDEPTRATMPTNGKPHLRVTAKQPQ